MEEDETALAHRVTLIRGDGTGPELVAAADPFGDLAEALRGVRARLMLGPLSADAPRLLYSIGVQLSRRLLTTSRKASRSGICLPASLATRQASAAALR